MTSSLVGSEMCIRDSSLFVAHWPSETVPGAGCVQMCRRAVFWCDSGSVSYTHLTLPTICSV
eukprot:12243697-Prorocentrum_lima.AAC.1